MASIKTLREGQKSVTLDHRVKKFFGADSVLVLEPFYGGSHKQLLDILTKAFPGVLSLHTLPPKKWHWRARVSALYFAQNVPKQHEFRTLFASSVLNLCELCSLRPDLASLHKVIYFHENQLEYPVVNPKDRDFQYGYNQILSCLVADAIYFNSRFNMESFLCSIQSFLKQMPDFRPNNLEPDIRTKCQVLYFPMEIPRLLDSKNERTNPQPLSIVWPHRWEHDKNPELFFWVLFQLQECGQSFRVSVLGESCQEVPAIFLEAKNRLSTEIDWWGFQESRQGYLNVLCEADVVVSTSNHEFFGVAMIESVACGCYPLCPNKLVYPEIFPNEYLYNTPNQLLKALKNFCKHPHLVRKHKIKMDVTKYSWESLAHNYREAIRI